MSKLKYKSAGTYTPNFSYTYPGVLKTELFQKPKIMTPALSEFGRIMQGIRSGEYINLVTPLTSVLTAGSANCTPTYTTVGSITDRKIQTGLFDINIEWCKKQFQNIGSTANVLGDSDLIGDGLSGYELGGKLRQVILDEILEQARQDIWKYVLFGQDASGNTPWNVIDGVFTKMFDSFGSYCVKHIRNSFPNQFNSVLGTDEALTALRNTWQEAHILLKQIPNNKKVFWVTGSVYENLYASYESKQYGTELQFKYLIDGVATLSFRGIPVVPIYIADYSLENDTSNPYYNLLRHFIIYTTPENHIIGVENASDLNNVEMCYDCRTKTTLIQGEMRFGYNFVHCDLTALHT
jgi:hypothetical protein